MIRSSASASPASTEAARTPPKQEGSLSTRRLAASILVQTSRFQWFCRQGVPGERDKNSFCQRVYLRQNPFRDFFANDMFSSTDHTISMSRLLNNAV